MALNPAMKAGLFYGSLVFALGFVLGTLRELILAPLIGRHAAVLIEAPLILLAAWFLCWAIIRRFAVAPAVTASLMMGFIAFALLMIGEAAVAVFGFNRSLAMHLGAYLTPRGVLELLPQLAFALFPLVHLLRQAALK